MEDSGYLPRLAVMTNKVFKKMGLNGKAVLPMVLGLGCDTMATMTTRILDTEKDRTIVTLLLALGVPCSAQLGVILGMFANLPTLYLLIWIFVLAGLLVSSGISGGTCPPWRKFRFYFRDPTSQDPSALKYCGENLGPDRMVSEGSRSPVHSGHPCPLRPPQDEGVDLSETTCDTIDCLFFRSPCQSDRSLYHRFSPERLWCSGSLRPGQGRTAQFPSDPGEPGNHHPLHPLYCPILYDDQERGLKKTLWMSAVIFPIAFGVGGMLNFLLKWIGI